MFVAKVHGSKVKTQTLTSIGYNVYNRYVNNRLWADIVQETITSK